MELRSIETFLAVAELGSFSKAAQKLGYSQSAVTVQVQRLERELGARLFDRVSRGAVLTDQGRAFSFHAHEAVRAARLAAAAVRMGDKAEPRDTVGTLRVGSVESISTALLPAMLARYHELYPRVEIVVKTSQRDRLIEGVRSNSIDLFLTMEEKLNVPALVRATLREEPIVVVAPRGMAPDGPLDAHALARLPFVLTERGESYRRELERLLAEQDEALAPVVEAGNTETLVHLVERGVGLSFLPRFSVEGALAAGTLEVVETTLPAVHMASQLLYHANKWLAPHMTAFVDLAREFFSGSGGA